MARTITDRVICAARVAWYGIYEKARLKAERNAGGWQYSTEFFTDPRVSVLIPTYNRADLLIDRCLKSVLAQTYTNLEIVVADHSSSDGTAARGAALGA